MARLFYSGDINIEHGGYFYSLENMQYDYADVTRLQPCSDAGGPDNLFWLETLTVNIPADETRLTQALECCGQTLESYKAMTKAARAHCAIDCCMAYGYYDQDQSRVIQLGKSETGYCERGFGPITVDTVLRANASLYNYARRVARGGF